MCTLKYSRQLQSGADVDPYPTPKGVEESFLTGHVAYKNPVPYDPLPAPEGEGCGSHSWSANGL